MYSAKFSMNTWGRQGGDQVERYGNCPCLRTGASGVDVMPADGSVSREGLKEISSGRTRNMLPTETGTHIEYRSF